MKITINVKGQQETIDALEMAKDEVIRRVAGAVEETAVELQRDYRARAPQDTGQLRQSIQVQQLPTKAAIPTYRVGGDLVYAWYQEFGFRRAQQGNPPPYAGGRGVGAWAMRHGIPPAALARAMGKKDATIVVKKRPALVPALANQKPRFIERIRVAISGAFQDAGGGI